MASKYRKIDAVGQYDENACWAACMEWWLKATNLGSVVQDDLFTDYLLLRGDGGSISREGLVQLMDDPRWYMERDGFYHATSLTKAKLKEYLKKGPVYFGYYDKQILSNHVNVIYGVSGNQVYAMEPHFKQNSDGSYQGRHVMRSLSYYNFTGEVFIGTPKAYTSSGSDESYYY
jgi:hypothetical protein